MTRALEDFADNIWLANGPIVESAGFRYPTRMAIIQLADGGLFLWSPIALNEALRAELDARGEVRFLVAPNKLHNKFLPVWREAYPRAKLYAPPGLRARRRDIAFDEELSDAPAPTWSDEIDQTLMRGNIIAEEAIFFHRQSRTVLIADLIQNFPPTWFKGWRAWIARLDAMVAEQPQTPMKFRLAFVNRAAARASLRRLLAWDAEKVVMAHAEPVRENGRAFLKRAFRWLH